MIKTRGFWIGYCTGFITPILGTFILFLLTESGAPPPQQTQRNMPRVSQQASRVPTPTPKPEVVAAPRTWQVIEEWDGSGIKTTEKFTVGSEWCIDWNTTPGSFAGILQIYIENGSGVPGIVANVMGASTDVSYQYEPGTYWLTINASQPYKVRVLDKQ